MKDLPALPVTGKAALHAGGLKRNALNVGAQALREMETSPAVYAVVRGLSGRERWCMGNISGGMKSLCEDIAAARGDRKRNMGDRKRSLKDLRGQAESVRNNARKFVDHCREVHKEMSQGLKEGLGEDRKELIKNVSSLREDFRNKEREIRADLNEANRLWSSMNKTLESKKKGETK
jgi:hypothetical protein